VTAPEMINRDEIIYSPMNVEVSLFYLISHIPAMNSLKIVRKFVKDKNKILSFNMFLETED
jgi:hypothetical protein